jgi:anthranilate synthase component 1
MKHPPILLHTRERTILADTITPVSIYLKLRDRFVHSFLLESSDYHGTDNSFSYICCDPLAWIKVGEEHTEIKLPGKAETTRTTRSTKEEVTDFAATFHTPTATDGHYIRSGLFGYLGYGAFAKKEQNAARLPDPNAPGTHATAQYHLFRYIIAFDHFKNTVHLIEASTDSPGGGPNDAAFAELEALIQRRDFASYDFALSGSKTSSETDASYLDMVRRGIEHCHLGDVFQVVLSRSFVQPFRGDDFQVYRTLRSVNPSPYLFYFDYGDFRIFGSSPEAQVVVHEGMAEIHPIAGTFRRTGDDEADAAAARALLEDPKENAEHVMLVDLARNDLSRSCDDVKVETYKQVQYFSHVIHLVSKVTGRMAPGRHFMDIVAETFPAGTLSGAPKLRAMQIIAENEKQPRGFYGGAVGFMDFSGNFNHAIVIRSFVSQRNTLRFQAGAGVVAVSVPESELQEVYNKLGALEKAIQKATEL